MSLEQKINYRLNSCPTLKRIIKRLYQSSMYLFSKKIKSEGDIVRLSPDDHEHEYFFGYYDKCPWDKSNRYILCLKADNTWSDVSPRSRADIILIDTTKEQNDTSRYKKIAETNSWNVQQGCMVQWLGPDFSSFIIYNDCRDGKYVSIIKDIINGNEKVIDAPIYTVSEDGKTALTLDFSRLYNLRPGYGYYNVQEKTKDVALPDSTAVWKIDLESSEVLPLLSYKDFSSFQPRDEMLDISAIHKVNHLMISPDGNRCMVLYRWFIGSKKYTRLITFNTDGTDMYVLSDDDMVSHCCWKDNEHILAFENKNDYGLGYYLMKDKSHEYKMCWPNLIGDGHPSYSPNRRLVVTDSYPNRNRISSIWVMDTVDESQNASQSIARVFSPFKYDNDTRCDLHPRWNRRGDAICFDAVFEGHRGLYKINVPKPLNYLGSDNILSQDKLVSCIIPSYKRCDSVTRAIDSVLNQTYKNIEVCVVDDNTPGDEYSIKLQNALQRYSGDKRVRYIAQKEHKNGAVARNVGIKAANGDYIGFLDDDDEWLPNKIERQMMVFQSDSSIDAVTTLWVLLQGGKEIRRCSHYSTDDLQFKILMRQVSVFTPTVLIKKSAIERFGGFDGNLLRHQDLQFFTDALETSKFVLVPEYLVNVYADSDINKPNVDKIISTKNDFFKSINSIFMKYGLKERKRIKNAHYFEIVLVALRAKKVGLAIKYFFKTGLYPRSFLDLYRRYKER